MVLGVGPGRLSRTAWLDRWTSVKPSSTHCLYRYLALASSLSSGRLEKDLQEGGVKVYQLGLNHNATICLGLDICLSFPLHWRATFCVCSNNDVIYSPADCSESFYTLCKWLNDFKPITFLIVEDGNSFSHMHHSAKLWQQELAAKSDITYMTTKQQTQHFPRRQWNQINLQTTSKIKHCINLTSKGTFLNAKAYHLTISKKKKKKKKDQGCKLCPIC